MSPVLSVIFCLALIPLVYGTYYYRRPIYHRRHHHHHHHQPRTFWYNQPIRVTYQRPINAQWIHNTRPYPATGINLTPGVPANRNTHHPVVLDTNTVWPSNRIWPSETVDPSVVVNSNGLWKDLGIDKNSVLPDLNDGKDGDIGFPSIPGPDGTFPDVTSTPDIIIPNESVVDSTDITPIIPDTGLPDQGTDETMTPDQGTDGIIPMLPEIPIVVDTNTIDPVVPDQGIDLIPVVPEIPIVVDTNTIDPVVPDQGFNQIPVVTPEAPTGTDVQNETQAPTCHITGCPSGHECVFADNWICPIYIKEIPCECRLGCRLDYNFVPFGKEITIDECGNVCKCTNIYGAAECTQRMCNPADNNDTTSVITDKVDDQSIVANLPQDVPEDNAINNIPDVVFPEFPNFPDTLVNGGQSFIPVNSENQIVEGNTKQAGSNIPVKPIVISRNIIVPSNNLLAEKLKSDGPSF